MYECIFVMLSELRTGGGAIVCHLLFLLKKGKKPANNTDMTKLPRVLLLITI